MSSACSWVVDGAAATGADEVSGVEGIVAAETGEELDPGCECDRLMEEDDTRLVRREGNVRFVEAVCCGGGGRGEPERCC